MIRSMTGFGKAERLAPNKKFSVEIRSLNSKQLDLSIKMPSAYRSLEPEIRTLARSKFSSRPRVRPSRLRPI